MAELRRGENWQPAVGEIIVATPGTLSDRFFAGQPVEITGVIARPPAPLAEGLFDYRDYLQTRGIYYQLKTGSTNDWQLAVPSLANPPLTDRFLNWSRKTLALGLPVEDEPLRLLWAMTLGWRTAFTGDISEPFLRAGTMHLFAIDGLRIALIAAMLVALAPGDTGLARLVRCRRHSGHLVLHRRHRLGIFRPPGLGDDDHHPRRLGVETTG